MTCTNAASTNPGGTANLPTTRAKATLFCAECDFSAPLNGPWDVTAGSDYRVVRCPACGYRVS